MESGKRNLTALWVGLAAVATGAVVATVVSRLRARAEAEVAVRHQLRDVQDVLADCYNKISEIEQSLPELSTSRTSPVTPSVARPETH